MEAPLWTLWMGLVLMPNVLRDAALTTNHQRHRAGSVGRSSSLNLTAATAAIPGQLITFSSAPRSSGFTRWSIHPPPAAAVRHGPRHADSQTCWRPPRPAMCSTLLATRRRWRQFTSCTRRHFHSLLMSGKVSPPRQLEWWRDDSVSHTHWRAHTLLNTLSMLSNYPIWVILSM